MGLFDSKSKVSTEYNTTTNTQQTDNSGNTGFLGIGGSVDTSLRYESADDNSIANSGNTTTNTSTSTATTNYLSDSGAVKAAAEVANGAFGVANLSLDNALRVNSNSLDTLKGLISGAFDNSVTLARDSIAANKAATDTAINGFGSLAQQNSASDGDRISKVAIYAFAALAAVFVVPALFRGKAVSL